MGTVTSNAATLTVNVPPSITTQPTSQTVTAGQTATLSVTATGTAPLSYQWKKNGTAISGATSSTYTTPATTASDNGAQFTVTVSNSVGTVTSNAATLTVTTPGQLSSSASSVSFGNVNVGSSSTQSVALTNSGGSNVSISNVTISGAGFSVNGISTGLILSPGASVTMNVTFAPAASGSVTGSVTITSTALSSPNTVTLSGTGVVLSGLDLTAPNCGIQSTAQQVPTAAIWNEAMPAAGGTYTDPGYCTVKRITNIGAGIQMVPFYSLVQVFSAGDTKLLLYNGEGAHWNIYDLNGNVVISGATFDSASNDNATQPRWDRFDDSVIWVTTGHSIEKCTIMMGTPGSMSCAITHTFSEYAYSVVFPGDTDMNENGWVPMVGQNVQGSTVDIFMFQPNTNAKAGTYTLGCTGDGNSTQPACVHRLESTPNNGITTEGIIDSGQHLWLPPFSGSPSAWNPSSDHHNSGYYIDGTTLVGAFEDFDTSGSGSGLCGFKPAVIFYTATGPNYANNCPLGPSSSSGTWVDSGWHVNYMDHATRPWLTWTRQGGGNGGNPPSLYFQNQSGYADPSSSNWMTYQGAIIMTRIDSNVTSVGQATTKVFQLALAHGRQNSNYWADVYASTSWDGKYVAFGSNAGFNPNGCPNGFAGDCGDTYLIGPLF